MAPAIGALSGGGVSQGVPGAVTSPPVKNQVIGIQIGSISFLDEGTERVLEILQEKACVNTLFVATFTYGNGIASRMIPGHPFPDHGVQEYDTKFHGGNYATPHLQFYKNTIISHQEPAAFAIEPTSIAPFESIRHRDPTSRSCSCARRAAMPRSPSQAVSALFLISPTQISRALRHHLR